MPIHFSFFFSLSFGFCVGLNNYFMIGSLDFISVNFWYQPTYRCHKQSPLFAVTSNKLLASSFSAYFWITGSTKFHIFSPSISSLSLSSPAFVGLILSYAIHLILKCHLPSSVTIKCAVAENRTTIFQLKYKSRYSLLNTPNYAHVFQPHAEVNF